MKRNRNINIGLLEIPKEYISFSKEEKQAICDRLIDIMLEDIDKNLDPVINRINFLDQLFDSSIQTNEEMENYEICCVLKDCKNRLNED